MLEDIEDPEMSLTPDGMCQEWRRNGKLHRDNNMPALVWQDGSKTWYVHGKMHRDDGPAYEGVPMRSGGQMEYQWHIHGEEVTEQEHKTWRQQVLLAEQEARRLAALEALMEACQEATVLKSPINVGRPLSFQRKPAFA